MIDVALADELGLPESERGRLVDCARAILAAEGPPRSTLSLAVIDDGAMHELNRRYLDHDYPTDVISFVLEAGPDWLDGEVIASGETASQVAPGYGWSAAEELLLYIVHGTLHIVGYDDGTDAAREQMRERERHYLSQLGIELPAPRHPPRQSSPGATRRFNRGNTVS